MLPIDMFRYYLNQKNYRFCITILQKEVKNILIQNIQKQDPTFQYTTLTELKTHCYSCLSEQEGKIAMQLYMLSIKDIPEIYELKKLLTMYQSLINL